MWILYVVAANTTDAGFAKNAAFVIRSIARVGSDHAIPVDLDS